MGRHRFGKSLAIGILVATLPLLGGATGLTSNWQIRVLAAHNYERATIGIPPLRWNPTLVASAQRWADHLAATGEFAHAPENQFDPEGENIWAGTRSYYSSEAMVGAWIAEKKHFKPGLFPTNNSITGKMEDIGHYTQLMWRHSGSVGCAMARSNREDLLVCRYAEAGNWVGEVPF